MSHKFTDMNKEDISSIDEIIEQYEIPREMVEEKKKQMINCFPFPSIK